MSNELSLVFESLSELSPSHSPDLCIYKILKAFANKQVSDEMGMKGVVDLWKFGEIILPYEKFGVHVDSTNLFDLDELVIFLYYWLNKTKYSSVSDIGANIGLHSIIMNKCGYDVKSYEPDPHHFDLLRKNLSLNGFERSSIYNAAVSNNSGSAEFVRVIGNTTGSHISGDKGNLYGELEKYNVDLINFKTIIKQSDLMKIDVEGHEDKLILATDKKDWESTDALVEIQSPNNAKIVYDHLTNIGVSMYSQKNNWKRVVSVDDVPSSYKEGTLFISMNDMVW